MYGFKIFILERELAIMLIINAVFLILAILIAGFLIEKLWLKIKSFELQ